MPEESKVKTKEMSPEKFGEWLETQPEVLGRFSANSHPLVNWLGRGIKAGAWNWRFEDDGYPVPNWMQSIMYSTFALPYGVRIYKQQALAWLAHSYTDTRYH